MRILFIFFLIISCNSSILSQENIDDAFDFAISFRGLTRGDVTIPVSFDPDKSPATNTKLVLPVVKELMEDPLKYNEVIDGIIYYKDKSLEEIIIKLFSITDYNKSSFQKPKIPNSSGVSEFEKNVINFIQQTQSSGKNLLSVYSKEELGFIYKNIFAIIADTDTGLEDKHNDIFIYNEARDSSIKISRKVMYLLDKLDREKILLNSLSAFYFVSSLNDNINHLKRILSSRKLQKINNGFAEGEFHYYYDSDGIRIAVGGEGRNVYKGFYDLIIDLGGDDLYEPEKEDGKYFTCIIDVSGNDSYTAKSDFSLAGGIFSSSFIFDHSGDDVYKGRSVSLGAAICGTGVLIDSSGNDIYSSHSFSQAAASFGAGLLIDTYGNDIYRAISFSQGFGMTEGAAMLLDRKGSDSYLADLRSLDIGRYEDHYITMSQGYAYGVRPYYAGGVGILFDAEGNDLYYTDIFGQGGAYWYGLGILIDLAGHDKYNSYQYAQGAGIHLAVGILKDFDGWDSYISNGVSQGCGHDYGVGILHDIKGNDNYSAYSLSQGAGSANGIGVLIDESGHDGYLSKDVINTRGYGNPRREFGSLGIFLDASGEDFYSQRGPDSVLINSSVWGITADYYLQDIPAQLSGNTFKVGLTERNDYTAEEYFIMAKTIEPRFSLWQELGFAKLIEDSINTAKLFLTKLGTDDHRETSLMRNIIVRIPIAVSSVFSQKLDEYRRNTSILSPEEVSLIAYLFGFTNSDLGREALYDLTFDDNLRVRTNSVNSLGKLSLDTALHKDYIHKVAMRLNELAKEKPDQKLYMKDIAFAMNLYREKSLIPALIDIMNYNYFPVRMLAAEALQKYANDYYSSLSDIIIGKIVIERKWFQAFLTSLRNLDDEKFKNLYERILIQLISDEVLKLNIAEELKTRSGSTVDPSIKTWAE